MNPENEKTEEELKWEEFVKKETAQNSEWTKQYEKEQLKNVVKNTIANAKTELSKKPLPFIERDTNSGKFEYLGALFESIIVFGSFALYCWSVYTLGIHFFFLLTGVFFVIIILFEGMSCKDGGCMSGVLLVAPIMLIIFGVIWSIIASLF